MPVYSKRLASSNPRSQYWCFTLNNYSDVDIATIKGIPCDFLVFGEEHAPTTGTPHLQGYVEFPVAKQRSTVSNLFRHRAHLSIAEGSIFQNVVYCTKEGHYWIYPEDMLTSFMASASLTFPPEWLPEEVAEFRLGYNINWTPQDVQVYMTAHSKYIAFLQSKYPEKPRKKLIN